MKLFSIIFCLCLFAGLYANAASDASSRFRSKARKLTEQDRISNFTCNAWVHVELDRYPDDFSINEPMPTGYKLNDQAALHRFYDVCSGWVHDGLRRLDIYKDDANLFLNYLDLPEDYWGQRGAVTAYLYQLFRHDHLFGFR